MPYFIADMYTVNQKQPSPGEANPNTTLECLNSIVENIPQQKEGGSNTNASGL